MPGPTTEVLNDDIKALREDLHKVEVALIREVQRVELGLARDLAVHGNQLRGIVVAIRLLIVLAITSIGGSIWWGATVTAKVDGLERRLDKSDARFDRLEASIGKVLEQTRAPGPIPK
jgi:hypothetical protein